MKNSELFIVMGRNVLSDRWMTWVYVMAIMDHLVRDIMVIARLGEDNVTIMAECKGKSDVPVTPESMGQDWDKEED